ncbi:cysteine synthase A [Candidatus Woesebacteria bacterium]|nr:cysteine synthase A [Candidatus Woesebacteria bacterium]
MKYKKLTDLIGNTPLISMDFEDIPNTTILVKMELYNVTGSAKDRMAFYMLNKAERQGTIKPGATIIEATTGNTGIAFSALAAARGYKMIAVMPEGQSEERIQMIKAFGAELILTPYEEGPAGAIKKRDDMAKEMENVFVPDQFANPDNIEEHVLTTANEIIRQTEGKIDYILHGIGTGGTLMGVAKVFKRRYPHVKMIALEPDESAVMSGDKPGEHNIQGIGEGFIPPLVDMSLVDEVVRVSTEDAIKTAREIATKKGVLVGFSSGANIAGIRKLSKHDGKTFLTFFCDRGERYLSIK